MARRGDGVGQLDTHRDVSKAQLDGLVDRRVRQSQTKSQDRRVDGQFLLTRPGAHANITSARQYKLIDSCCFTPRGPRWSYQGETQVIKS